MKMQRERRAANPDYDKKWYRDRHEQVLASKRRYRERNAEVLRVENRERARRRRQDPAAYARMVEGVKRSYLKHKDRVDAKARARDAADPRKHRAREAVRRAIKNGTLQKPSSCQLCGSVATGKSLHAHHADYSRPLDVEFLCAKCHRNHHVAEATKKVA
jgi:hypothetical protein